MPLSLKVVEGPLKDNIYELIEGLTLGRDKATINLKDAKVSGIHARVEQVAEGEWILADQGSKNGIRVGTARAEKVSLKPGVKFVIGEHAFEVVNDTPPPPKPVKKQRYWNEILAEYVGDGLDRLRDKPKPLSALNPALVLEFVKGAQVNCKWVLGFGPREIGANSLDLPIWEPGAPPVCFEILPSNDGLVFKTAHPDKVLLNGESVDSRVLRMGDTIHIMDTLIEVDFAE